MAGITYSGQSVLFIIFPEYLGEREWHNGIVYQIWIWRFLVWILVWCTYISFNTQLRYKTPGNFFFSLSGFSFTDTDNSQDSRGKEGPSFSTLPLPPAHEHSDIYLQLCTWDDYHIFLIATLVFTRLLLDGIYHLIELLFDWLMM